MMFLLPPVEGGSIDPNYIYFDEIVNPERIAKGLEPISRQEIDICLKIINDFLEEWGRPHETKGK